MAKSISDSLKKLDHYDKDERYMACNDLKFHLGSDKVIDAALQTSIRVGILKRLDDESGDVHQVAIGCLEHAVEKFGDSELAEFAKTLGSSLIDDKKAKLVEVYSTGFKAMITRTPDKSGAALAPQLMGFLTKGIKGAEQAKALLLLGLLKDLIDRFGTIISKQHDELLQIGVNYLTTGTVPLRRSASTTLGSLVRVLNDASFEGLMKNLIGAIDKHTTHDEALFTYIETISVFSRGAGVRIGKFMDQIIPLLSKFSDPSTETEEGDVDARRQLDQLRVYCLEAFSALIVQCPGYVTEYVEQLITMALQFIKYDPNRIEASASGDGGGDDDDDDDAWGGDDDDAWGDDGDDDGGGWGADEGDVEGDPDDESWKVRRTAVQLLRAFIKAKNDILRGYYERLVDGLLKRFAETEAVVKADVFSAFRDLMLAAVTSGDTGAAPKSSADMDDMPLAMPTLYRQRSSFQTLEAYVPLIVAAISEQFKDGTLPTRQGIVSLVRELVVVRQGHLEEHFETLIPILQSAVADKDKTMRKKGLELLFLFIRAHRPATLVSFVGSLTAPVASAVAVDFTRVRALALTGELAKIIRHTGADYDTSLDSTVRDMFKTAYEVLKVQDIETKVKSAAVTAIGDILSQFGDLLKGELKNVLPILLERLGNPVTQPASLRALIAMADSSIGGGNDLHSIAEKASLITITLIKKKVQELRHEAAQCTESLVRNSGDKFSSKTFDTLVTSAAESLSDSDLGLSALLFKMLRRVLETYPKSVGTVVSSVYPKILEFIKSPILQGNALESLKSLFETFLAAKSSKLTYDKMVSELEAAAVPDADSSTYSSIAQCVATLVAKVDGKQQDKTISKFVKTAASNAAHLQQVALGVIGQVGRTRDLSNHSGIEKTVFAAFSSSSEPVKFAASQALGFLTVGNLDTYLPILLDLITKHEDKSYLLLNSLKEILSSLSDAEGKAKINKHKDRVVPMLLKNASMEEESARNSVAECLGKWVAIDASVLDEIKGLLGNSNPLIRGVMVASFKFAAEALESFSLIPTLQDEVATFLKLMTDSDLSVARLAFLTFHGITCREERLIRSAISSSGDEIPPVLDLIYKGTVLRKELVREIDLGPFKHKVDDGLPLRKAAYQCLNAILDHSSTRILNNFTVFVKHLKASLTDPNDDLQTLGYNMFVKIASNHPKHLLESLTANNLPAALMAGIKVQIKKNKSDDSGRALGILRASVLTLRAINNVEGAQEHEAYQKFYGKVLKTKVLVGILREIEGSEGPK